jgi:4-alpha-glucanotransferase
MANLFPRSSGVLLHPTSLPGPYGIGDLGPSAYEFLDFLEAGGQSVWQMLPLGPTGYGDSPYQCFSAFAGNPLLISLDVLAQEGLLDERDLEQAKLPDHASIDFPTVIAAKTRALNRAAERFATRNKPLPDGRGSKYSSSAAEMSRDRQGAEDALFAEFRKQNSAWLDDYALFMALKDEFGMTAWPHWPAKLRSRDRAALEEFRVARHERINAHIFLQYAFFTQWTRLRKEAKRRGIRLMGDIPIYAAGDSSDVWAQPHLWLLREDGHPAQMAGVPPDYFSSTGQLWGNPIYDWKTHAASNYAWWIERLRATFQMFDLVRLDHFRGFQAYWQVPFGETTAKNGEWVTGPGIQLFEVVEQQLGALPLVAENLGVITPEVEAIRHKFNFPGMSILQFAFGTDPQAPDFRPHNYPRELVAYSGTHDNDTTIGWWTSSGAGDTTRTPEEIARERASALSYLAVDGAEMNWTFIRTLMASVANTVIFPVQDLLGLGSEARMNTPATLGRNWKFRLLPGQLVNAIAVRLREFASNYDRLPR